MVMIDQTVVSVALPTMQASTGAVSIDTFDPRERGKAMGIYTGISMVFLALGAAAPSERSQASGIVQTVRQVGAAVGIAVLGARQLKGRDDR